MDVDLVVNRDQEELDLEAVKLRAARVGVGIREALELERVHLVKEEILDAQLHLGHPTEDLRHLKEDSKQGEPHLRELHLRRRLQQEELPRTNVVVV